MTKIIERALTADVAAGARAVTTAAVREAHRQATAIVGASPKPGTAEWSAEAGTGVPEERQRAWQLACLRIELAAGLDGFGEVLMLRRLGATWNQIGAAAGTTRQAAHERWGAQVLAVLDRYGTGELGGPVADDDPAPVGDA